MVTNFVNLGYLQLDNDGSQTAPFVFAIPYLYIACTQRRPLHFLDWLAGTQLGELQFYGNRLGDIAALVPMTTLNYLDISYIYLDISPASVAWQVITNIQTIHAYQNYTPANLRFKTGPRR